MKRNISTHRDDKPTHLSCNNCGGRVGLLPSGYSVTNKTRSTRTILSKCADCGNEQSLHVGKLDA